MKHNTDSDCTKDDVKSHCTSEEKKRDAQIAFARSAVCQVQQPRKHRKNMRASPDGM